MKQKNICSNWLGSCLFAAIAFIPACSKNLEQGTNNTPAELKVAAASAASTYGQLRVQGNRIVGQNGQNVQLRGMSFFWSQWMGGFYNASTVNWLKNDWHCNIVRAAMGVESGGYLENPDAEKNKVIAVVDAAINAGLYVLIDWHDHAAENHTTQAKAFFGEMARRYGSSPNVVYEVYNEPMDVSWSNVIKPYCEAVIGEIRKYDPDNIIICGTPFYSQKVDQAAADPIVSTGNIAYTLHFYAATHKQDLRNVAASALSRSSSNYNSGRGIALFVTEFGTCEASGSGYLDEAETRNWWSFLDQNSISWCNWSVADKEETASIVKPGASTTGGWSSSTLTASGKLVRSEVLAKNPTP